VKALAPILTTVIASGAKQSSAPALQIYIAHLDAALLKRFRMAAALARVWIASLCSQ
jgi:hypothetical protein